MNEWMTSKGKYTENEISLVDKKSEVMSCPILSVALLCIWLFLILDLTWKVWPSCPLLYYLQALELSLTCPCCWGVMWRTSDLGAEDLGSHPYHNLTFHVALHDHLTSSNLHLVICEMKKIMAHLPHQFAQNRRGTALKNYKVLHNNVRWDKMRRVHVLGARVVGDWAVIARWFWAWFLVLTHSPPHWWSCSLSPMTSTEDIIGMESVFLPQI